MKADLNQGESERLNQSRVDEDALQQQAAIECELPELKKGTMTQDEGQTFVFAARR